MFCIHCGARNPENASFCSACGKAIGAAEDTAAAAEAAALISRSADSARNEPREVVAPVSVPAPIAPQLQKPYEAAAAGKGKPLLWVLGGFGACLVIVIAVAFGSRLNRTSSGSEPGRENVVPETSPTTAPATYAAPAPAADPAPATDTLPAPVSAAVQPPPQPAPAAPQNPIVGDWKATTFIGSTIGLHLGADGRYILNPGSDEGVYSYSSGDGTLRLQSNSFFSSGIMVWSCQVSGDSLSCVDPNGAGHVYNRIR
jgi:hypothetical protein